ncbi:hypothetical protein [Nostoc sp. FACHB-110]|uniref:hypothetical protein n=1 Tax=Nostoc sp. FACHB-110 TaxID=2692834 RepID=UPI0016851784|nr:hypothetical protein [Nostoc sp. FACHB-110]MBD2438991.1 hypothetical protein [Nostoc sp. FACHB-110]
MNIVQSTKTYHAITGVAISRKLADGRLLRRLHKQNQQVYLFGLNFPVTVSWYYLKRDNGKLETSKSKKKQELNQTKAPR